MAKSITKSLCKALYLEFTNNYLTIECFADRMNCTILVDKEQPIAFYQSIINRGRILFHGASYDYFTGDTVCRCVNPVNREFFNRRRIERLLSEHSA